MKCGLLVLGYALAVLVLASGNEFSKFQLYLVHPESHENLHKLKELRQQDEYDFWDTPRLNKQVRVMVSLDQEVQFEDFLDKHGIAFDRVANNVQQILNKEQIANEDHHKRARRDAASRATIDFDHFWTLDEIYDYVQLLDDTYDTVTSFDIGTTLEGRPIKALTISKDGKITLQRPLVFMDAGIHAREWAGIMSVMNMIHEFVEHSEQYTEQLQETDYVIIPVLNPDGFVHTHEVNRLWRKNRVQNNLLCAGVDVNRNFPAMWRFTNNACHTYYAGTGPGSERESTAMMGLMDRYKSAMTMYIAVHTYGDMILWPWGYDTVPCDNWEEHDRLGKEARDAIMAIGGNEYEVGNSAIVLDYKASGASDDYAYTMGARLAYTIELSGGGAYGFDLPASQIKKVAGEAMEIYKIFGKYAGTLPLPEPAH